MKNENCRIAQAGVVAYRIGAHGPELVLVTSKRTRRWVIPKGNIKNGTTAAQSAIEEAFEEAGVAGVMGRGAIGTFRYRKSTGVGLKLCEVRIFTLKVLKQYAHWPERRERRRLWVPPERAVTMVREKDLKRILQACQRRWMASSGERPMGR